MSNDMHHSKHLVSGSSRLTSLKGYVASHTPSPPTRHTCSGGLGGSPGGEHERKSWRAWAGQKFRGKQRGNDDVGVTEVINVFPGWATRRYAQGTSTEVPRPFEVEVFVSGYAISYRPPEKISRSQKTFIRLAKAFASLPKLIEDPNDRTAATTSLVQLTPSTEALLAQVKLPPRPSEIPDDFEVEALERQLKRATTVRPAKSKREAPNSSSSSLPSSSSSSTSSVDVSNGSLSSETSHTSSHAHKTMPIPNSAGSTPTEVIRRLHANIERRLQPFWSSVLQNRIMRLHLFTCPPSSASGPNPNTSQSDKFSFDPENGPLASQDVITGVDGSFQAKFHLKWDDLCHHPQGLHIAFGDDVEHEVMVVAQLLPRTSVPVAHAPNRMRSSPSPSVFSSASGSYDSSNPYTQQHDQIPPPPKPLTSISVIPITYSPIRVISDIDDTIKLSNVLSGARAVFQNVFVKELKDIVIPGMGEWYRRMWDRGVRFHYVSNGPFEVLPVLNEFFQISQLPPGSIKLKSYAGRSLFNDLLSAPAARKRGGVVDILDSFPNSQFFLIGDTGEQDLELYADLARERPHMILGVFVRDVDSGNAEREPIDDPTGWRVIGAAGTRPSENPLIPIEDDNTADNSSPYRTTSIYSSSNSSNPQADMNFMSNAHLEFLEEGDEWNNTSSDQTPRQNHYVFQREGSPLVDEKSYTDPESLTMDLGGSPRVSMTTTSASKTNRSQSYPLENSHRLYQPPQNKYVTQPPKPIQPPRVTANLIPKSQSLPNRNYGRQDSSSVSTTDSANTSSSFNNAINYGGANGGKMTEAEKKRYLLQTRVNRARTQMPSHIVLRVFREPSECVEIEEMLAGLHGEQNSI